MMENLKCWLIAVVATVFLITAAERLTPEGGAKKILRLAAGLLLLIVLLRPFTGEPVPELPPDFRSFRTETERLRAEYEAENRFRTETLIREKTEAYIETRAAESGLSLRAETRILWNGEDPTIGGVVLRGERNADFEKVLAAALGIDKGSISWEEGDQ